MKRPRRVKELYIIQVSQFKKPPKIYAPPVYERPSVKYNSRHEALKALANHKKRGNIATLYVAPVGEWEPLQSTIKSLGEL